jgi:hypothetical protein
MKKHILISQAIIITIISIFSMPINAQTIWMIDYTSYDREVQNVVEIIREDFKPMDIKFKYTLDDVYPNEGDFLIYILGDALIVDSSRTVVNFEYLFFRLNEYYELVFKGGNSRLFYSNKSYEFTRVLRNSIMRELKTCFKQSEYATPKDPNMYRARNETIKGIEP